MSFDEQTNPTGRKQVTLDDIEARFSEQSFAGLYKWLRHVITLSAGALTLLVSLQNAYVRPDAQALGLLRLCWGSLGISVLCGLLALLGEARKPAEAINHLRWMRYIWGDARTIEHITKNPDVKTGRRFRIYEGMAGNFLVVAIGCGVCFALLNLPAPQEPHLVVNKAMPVQSSPPILSQPSQATPTSSPQSR